MPDMPTGTITFLFTDIEGSTTLWEHHPDTMPTALARHDVLLRSVMTAHGGYVFKMVGDAVYAAFADPADAVSAALSVQRALAAEEWDEVGPLRVRMALHTGVAQHRDNDYFGRTLNRVARILSSSYGGQILLSAATVELVRDSLPGGTNVKDLGEHALKDLLRPEHIFQLTTPDLPAEFPALKSPAESEKQVQQIMGVVDFRQALDDRNWNQAEKVLQKYPNLAEGRSRLGLSMSNEVQEYFASQLRSGTFPQVGGPVTPMPYLQLTQTLPAPPAREAICWLEEALQYEDDPDGSVTASLVLMYGYHEEYEKMIGTFQKALTINPSLITYFQRPENLMMLIYACHDLASVEEVMQNVHLKLPKLDEVQQALREAADSKKNPYVYTHPYIEWYAVEWSTGSISGMPGKVTIGFQGKDGLTYAQIIKKGQLTITIPPEASMIIDTKTLVPIDEILKRLTERGIVLITRI
jgi:class 3 adenylate cyclase